MVVSVQHFNRCLQKQVSVTVDCEEIFKSFVVKCRADFVDEIGGCPFRLYSFPENFTDIDEREKVDTEEKFLSFLSDLGDLSKPPRVLYIFNETGSSPDQVPSKPSRNKKQDDVISVSSSDTCPTASSEVSIVTSRNSELSRCIKLAAGFTCQFCSKQFSTYNKDLHGAHLYEVKSVKKNKARQKAGKFTSSQQAQIFSKLGIALLNDPRNIMSLCGTCNFNFDEKNLAIGPRSHGLIVSSRIFSTPIDGVPDLKTYGDLNAKNKTIKFFDSFQPSEALLERRLRKFLNKQSLNDGKNYVSSSDSEKITRIKRNLPAILTAVSR